MADADVVLLRQRVSKLETAVEERLQIPIYNSAGAQIALVEALQADAGVTLTRSGRFGKIAASGGGGGSGGTPALVFGTVNGAGVAATFLRDDDSIAIFDATVPTTQAFADAAASGAAAFAARRDHKHGMPAANTGGHLIHDEVAAALTERTDMHFMGAGVLARDAAARTEVHIVTAYDAVVDHLDTNNAGVGKCYDTLQAAITAGEKTIFVRDASADAADITISAEAVTAIIGINTQTVLIPVNVTCTKADVLFQNLQFSGKTLNLGGTRDIVFACLFVGSVTAGAALLNGALTSATTSIPFDTGTGGGMAARGYMWCENEIIGYSAGGSAVSGTLTSSAVGRGQEETLAEGHLDNTVITDMNNGNCVVDATDVELTACRWVACSNPLLPACLLTPNASNAKITTCSFLNNTTYCNVMFAMKTTVIGGPQFVTMSDCKFFGTPTKGMHIEVFNADSSVNFENRFGRLAGNTFSGFDGGCCRLNAGLWAIAGNTFTGNTKNAQTAALNCAATAMTAQITRAGAVATVTATAHGYVTGDWITTQGATQPEYNVTAQITVTGANAYTYAVAGAPATPSTGAPTRQYSGLLATDNYLYYKTLAGAGTLNAKGQLRIGTEDIYFGGLDAISGTSSAIRFASCRRGQNLTTALANVDGAVITNNSQRGVLWAGSSSVVTGMGNELSGNTIDSLTVVAAYTASAGIFFPPTLYTTNTITRFTIIYLNTSDTMDGNCMPGAAGSTIDCRSLPQISIVGGAVGTNIAVTVVNMSSSTLIDLGGGRVLNGTASQFHLPTGRNIAYGRIAGDLACATVPMINKTGANSVAGDVVTVQVGGATDYAFVKNAGLASPAVCGVVLQAGVADGSAALVCVAPGLATVTCTTAGAVARGAVLQTSATAGQAQSAAAGVATGFGIAMTAKAAAAPGSVVALLRST